MPLKVGPNEAERFQVITALRAGKSFADATAELRKTVEPDWFDRNEEHLQDVAENGEVTPSLVAPPVETAEKPADAEVPAPAAKPARRPRGPRKPQ